MARRRPAPAPVPAPVGRGAALGAAAPTSAVAPGPDRRQVLAGLAGGLLLPASAAALPGPVAGPASLPAPAPGGPAARAVPPAESAAMPPPPPLALGLPVRLPRDFGAHPAWRTEWWYVTGTLQPAGEAAAALPRWGFQITFFRSRGELGAEHPSRFAARQLLVAHAALSDTAGPQPRLRAAQRVARQGFGWAEAAEGDTDLRLLDWTLRRVPATGDGAPAPGAPHHYLARLADRAFGLDLRLDATQPVLRQGAGGWSRKGPEPAQASLYLSEPQLAVRGTLQIDGRPQAVQGRAWLDHEWSEALLHPQAVGWDWVGVNLDEGGAFTAFRLRRADGSTLWSGGSLRARPGQPVAGAGLPTAVLDTLRRTDLPGRPAPPPDPDLQLFAPDSVRFQPAERRWRSPLSGGVYPMGFVIDSPAGRFTIRPRFDAQEIDGRGSTGSSYWEGLSTLHAPDGRRLGHGHLEMTGYAAPLRL